MTSQAERQSPFITDEEILARTNDDLLFLDGLDRNPATQKFANLSRDREAVEAAMRARNCT